MFNPIVCLSPVVADFHGKYGFFPKESREYPSSVELLKELPVLMCEARRRRKTLCISSLVDGLRGEIVRFDRAAAPR